MLSNLFSYTVAMRWSFWPQVQCSEYYEACDLYLDRVAF